MKPSLPVHNSLKVAIVLGHVLHGGVEFMAMRYLRQIEFEGAIDVFSHCGAKLPYRDICEKKGIRFIDMPSYADVIEYCRTLTGYCRKENYTIIHAHLSTMNLLPLWAGKRAGVPVRICHNHSTAHWGEGVKTAAKYLLKPWAKAVATTYCACGDHSARWMYGNRLCDKGHVTIIPNAIDLPAFTFDLEARARGRHELGLDRDTFVVGHVGRFVYQKNHAFLLKTFADILQKQATSVLLLIGEGPLLASIQQQASAMGMSRNVRFLGPRKDVPALYSVMDSFVLPSFYEGLPVVGIEAQANGLPCYFSEEVCPEILLSLNAQQLSLRLPPEAWAGAILQGKRVDASLPPEYDIHCQAPRLAQFYISLAQNA